MHEDRLRIEFERAFGAPAELIVRSPGRVNLIGEHTDYNDGWVLPAALDRCTHLAARRREDGVLRVRATRLGETDEASIADLRPADGPEWTRYVRGSVALALEALAPDTAGFTGADLLIGSDLPIGAGLSSSASIELGVLVAATTLAGRTLDPLELARLGHRVENEIVGVRTGIMDQLAVAAGLAGHALLIDCRSLHVEPVPLPAQVRILVLDSAVPRMLAGSAYNQRRAECESALTALRALQPSLRALRDVTPTLLAAGRDRLGEVELRRARHVVTENRRVLDGAEALFRGDVREFGTLMTASHASLRSDYEVSSPELDTLVAIALDTPGVLGARLTGAGFGGCAVALATAAAASDAAAAINTLYREVTGRDGHAFVCTPSDGTTVDWQAPAPE